MSSSHRDGFKRLRLEEALPLGSWKAFDEGLSPPRAPMTLEAYLEFLEDIDVFPRAKGPARLYSSIFCLPGCDEKNP